MPKRSHRKKRGAPRQPRQPRAVASPTPPSTARPEGLWWRGALLLFIGIVTYSNSLDGPFIFDDRPAIVESEAVRSWPDLGAVIDAVPESPFASRPLVSVSFAIDYALHGLDVTGYHVVNIALHLACGLLVFGVVRRTLARLGTATAGEVPDVRPWYSAGATDLAFAVAVLWTVHPLNSEVVNYLTQRTESMMALCYLGAFYAAIRALDGPRAVAWQTTAVVACALGMASKETMVTAPVLLVLYDRVFVFGSFREAIGSRGRLYGAVAATWVVLAASMWSSPRTSSTGFANANTSVWNYLLHQSVMITRYLRLTFWPDSLVLYYGLSVPTTLAAVWPTMLFVVSLFTAGLVTMFRRPMIGFAAAWFFITLAPASSVVPIFSEVGAERRMYLPVIAVITLAVLAVGWMVGRLRERWPPGQVPGLVRLTPLVLVVGLTVALGVSTRARTTEYASSLTIAESVLARWPNATARQMVGVELVNVGRNEDALPLLREAAEERAAAYLDYGTALFNVGRLDEAIQALQTYIELESESISIPKARRTLARAFGRQGRNSEAVEQLELALAEEPGFMETRGLLADALFAVERHDEAIRYYRDFLAADPTHAGALANLAISLAATGAADEALEAFRLAARADSRNPEAHLNLAVALIEQEAFGEAIDHLEQAIGLAPQNIVALDLLGRALAREGRLAAAIEVFEQILRIDPPNVPAREALRLLRGGR